MQISFYHPDIYTGVSANYFVNGSWSANSFTTQQVAFDYPYITKYHGNLFMSVVVDQNNVFNTNIYKYDGNTWTLYATTPTDSCVISQGVSNRQNTQIAIFDNGAYLLQNNTNCPSALTFWNGNTWSNITSSGGYVSDGVITAINTNSNKLYSVTSNAQTNNHVWQFDNTSNNWVNMGNIPSNQANSLNFDINNNILISDGNVIWTGTPQ